MPLYLLLVHHGCFSFECRNKTRSLALLGASLSSSSYQPSMNRLEGGNTYVIVKKLANKITRLLQNWPQSNWKIALHIFNNPIFFLPKTTTSICFFEERFVNQQSFHKDWCCLIGARHQSTRFNVSFRRINAANLQQHATLVRRFNLFRPLPPQLIAYLVKCNDGLIVTDAVNEQNQVKFTFVDASRWKRSHHLSTSGCPSWLLARGSV